MEGVIFITDEIITDILNIELKDLEGWSKLFTDEKDRVPPPGGAALTINWGAGDWSVFFGVNGWNEVVDDSIR